MCSKVLNGHIILTDTSITTILAPEMTYTPEFTANINDECFDDRNNWVRAIELPKQE